MILTKKRLAKASYIPLHSVLNCDDAKKSDDCLYADLDILEGGIVYYLPSISAQERVDRAIFQFFARI